VLRDVAPRFETSNVLRLTLRDLISCAIAASLLVERASLIQ
jgi:hypothetical protein